MMSERPLRRLLEHAYIVDRALGSCCRIRCSVGNSSLKMTLYD